MIGLGIIGGALGANLAADGHTVSGYDPDPERVGAFVATGGVAEPGPEAVGAAADVVFVAVATEGILPGICASLAASGRRVQIVVDVGTLPLADKERARSSLGAVGIPLLDCPISGTGGQAASRDIVFMVSGDPDAIASIEPLLATLARSVHDVGAFGNGLRMKLIANHLVAIHNVAAAEALVLAERSGLDLEAVLAVVADGAGTSRMFEERGPMMTEGGYDVPSARVSLFVKDLSLITDLARSGGAATPLLDSAAVIYREAARRGLGERDAAAVHAVLDAMATPEG